MGPQSSVAPPAGAAAGRWLRRFPAAAEPLWVCGLLLLQVVWAGAALPLSGKRWEWAQYLLLGLLFPALLAAAGLAGRLPRGWARPLTFLKAGLGAACLLLAWAYFPRATLQQTGLIWLFFVGILLAVWVVSPASRPGAGPAGASTYLLAGPLMSAVVWLAFSGWVANPLPWLWENHPWQFVLIAIVLALSLYNLLRPRTRIGGPPRRDGPRTSPPGR